MCRAASAMLYLSSQDELSNPTVELVRTRDLGQAPAGKRKHSSMIWQNKRRLSQRLDWEADKPNSSNNSQNGIQNDSKKADRVSIFCLLPRLAPIPNINFT